MIKIIFFRNNTAAGSASEVSIPQSLTGRIAIYGIDFSDCPAVDGESIALEWPSPGGDRHGPFESRVHLQQTDLHLENSPQRGSGREMAILKEESNMTVVAMEKLLHDQSIELAESRAIISAQSSSIQRLEQELQQLRSQFSPSDHLNGRQVVEHASIFQPPPHFNVPVGKPESCPGEQTKEEVARLRSELQAALYKVRLLEEQLQERNGLINYAEMVCSQVTRQLSKEDMTLSDDIER